MIIPSPVLLKQSPELAALAVLDAALLAAANSLLAAHIELTSDVYPQRHPTISACLAEAIVAHIDGLQGALERYRVHLALASIA